MQRQEPEYKGKIPFHALSLSLSYIFDPDNHNLGFNREKRSQFTRNMSVIDILTRVDAICKKYDKYDVDEHKHLNVSADAFARLYNAVEADTDAALQVQWHSTEELAARNNLALALTDSTQAIGAPKQMGGWTTSASPAEIKFDSDGRFESEYFQQTSQFRREYVTPKMKQD